MQSATHHFCRYVSGIMQNFSFSSLATCTTTSKHVHGRGAACHGPRDAAVALVLSDHKDHRCTAAAEGGGCWCKAARTPAAGPLGGVNNAYAPGVAERRAALGQ